MLYCGHNGYFVADITVIEGAAVVRANGPVTPGNIDRQAVQETATHHLTDFPTAGFCYWIWASLSSRPRKSEHYELPDELPDHAVYPAGQVL